MPKFVVAEMDKLDEPQSVVIHSIQIVDIAFQCIGPFKSWQDSDLSSLACLEDHGRAIGMNSVTKLDCLHGSCESIGRQRIHLARRRLVLAALDNSPVTIRVFAVVRHIATNICDSNIHIALAIHLNFFGGNRLDIFAVETARMCVHIHKHRGLVNLGYTRVRRSLGCGIG